MNDVIVLNEGNYADTIKSGVVVIDFYADWCGPCKMMAPVFAEAMADYEGRAVFAKLNVDENKNIAMQNSIMSIPTLLLFKDGQLKERLVGVVEKTTLYEKVDALL